jgi:septum formation protein
MSVLTLVLASTSPRRYQILSLLNLSFLMVPPDSLEEVSENRPPEQEALHQAKRKAMSLAARFPEAILVGSDTLINLDGIMIGKPRDHDDARYILRRLRGRSHEVITAVAMFKGTKAFEAVETARVHMREFTYSELEAYVATGDPLDKAGGYSIQGTGRGLVAGFDGDYLAVVGLPIRAVAEGLRQFGVEVTLDLDSLYRERDFLNWKSFA